ncbi:MAG: hypothetical protein ACE3JK_01045 [Sporolactobacillus sp.]
MNPDYPNLPIDPIILEKRSQIPGKIAEISYKDKDEAIKFMRIYGEHKMPITPMYDKICECLDSLNEKVKGAMEIV